MIKEGNFTMLCNAEYFFRLRAFVPIYITKNIPIASNLTPKHRTKHMEFGVP